MSKPARKRIDNKPSPATIATVERLRKMLAEHAARKAKAAKGAK